MDALKQEIKEYDSRINNLELYLYIFIMASENHCSNDYTLVHCLLALSCQISILFSFLYFKQDV